MKIVGILIILFGVVDFIGSYAGFDLWGIIGVPLPDIVWQYSAYIEMLIGYGIMSLGGGDDDEAE